MKDQVYIKFLRDYLALFDAVIEKYSIENDEIRGTATWLDDPDTQDFKWTININSQDAINLSDLCIDIKNNGYNRNDYITITEEQLAASLEKHNWGKGATKALIDKLLDIEVKMIDEGQETDSFFIHF